MSYFFRVVLLSLVGLSACSPATSTPDGSKQGAEAAHTAKLETAPPPAGPQDAAPAVIEIAVGAASGGGGSVEIRPISLAPVAPEWVARGQVEGRVEFVSLTGGVLARAASGYLELDDAGEGLALRRELELPGEQVFGYWPSSVWHIEVEQAEAEDDEPRFLYQMSTFVDRKGEWETLRRRGAKRWRDGVVQFRKGWHGGLLLRKDTSLTRIGSKRPKPRAGARKGKTIVDMFETRSGRLYTISERGGELYVQANCGDLSCVEANAKRLPRGTQWRFWMQAPRSSRHLSMVASLRDGEAELHYLLSYDKAGWVLEPLVEAPVGLWPDAEGGMWVIVSDELWHRDHQGHWTELELPGSGRGISAALTLDQRRLWLALPEGGATQLFSMAGAPG